MKCTCGVAVRFPDERREAPCEARSQEGARARQNHVGGVPANCGSGELSGRSAGQASCRAAARSDVPQAQINLPAHMEAYMWNRVDAKKSAFLCIKVSVHPLENLGDLQKRKGIRKMV